MATNKWVRCTDVICIDNVDDIGIHYCRINFRVTVTRAGSRETLVAQDTEPREQECGDNEREKVSSMQCNKYKLPRSRLVEATDVVLEVRRCRASQCMPLCPQSA